MVSSLVAFYNTMELSDKDLSRIKLSTVDNAHGDEAGFVIHDIFMTLELLLLVFHYR